MQKHFKEYIGTFTGFATRWDTEYFCYFILTLLTFFPMDGYNIIDNFHLTLMVSYFHLFTKIISEHQMCSRHYSGCWHIIVIKKTRPLSLQILQCPRRVLTLLSVQNTVSNVHTCFRQEGPAKCKFRENLRERRGKGHGMG